MFLLITGVGTSAPARRQQMRIARRGGQARPYDWKRYDAQREEGLGGVCGAV